MPFDPALPAQGSPLQSAVIRSQLTSLKALIDAISAITQAQVDGVTTLPAGDPATASVSVSGDTLSFIFGIPQGVMGGTGPAGPQGPPFADAVVDGVTTLPAGDAASASVSFDGTNVHFTFGIPQGFAGADGAVGPQGAAGMDGPPGPQGPPFANAVVDGVTTLPAGDPAAVSVSFDGTNVRFTFSIPQGQSGTPGEVTTAQMDTAISAAIAGTAQNPASIAPSNISFSDPPTASELTQLQDKFNELLSALKRS